MKKITFPIVGWLLSLILVGCNMPTVGGDGPRAWIDAPLNGSTLPIKPVIVRSHAASENGTSSAVLYVNGSQVRTDNVTDTSAPLVEISQVWVPAAAGDYEIYVIAIDGAGNEGRANPIRVHIGAEVVNPAPAEGGQPPETLEPVETKPPVSIETDTPTLTPTEPPPSTPTFTFTTNANCREGPSTQFEVDDSFLQGQSAQVDGRNQDSPRWWRVLKSNGIHCWVSDSTGTASGPVENVEVIVVSLPSVVITPTDTSVPPPPPPHPPASKPTKPANFAVTNKICNSNKYEVTLSWSDSSGEDGYYVYRDGAVIATLPAGVTSYDDLSPNYNAHNYFVQAFNSSGSANSPIASSTGCIF